MAIDEEQAQAFVKFYEAVERGKSGEKRTTSYCSIC